MAQLCLVYLSIPRSSAFTHRLRPINNDEATFFTEALLGPGSGIQLISLSLATASAEWSLAPFSRRSLRVLLSPPTGMTFMFEFGFDYFRNFVLRREKQPCFGLIWPFGKFERNRQWRLLLFECSIEWIDGWVIIISNINITDNSSRCRVPASYHLSLRTLPLFVEERNPRNTRITMRRENGP